MKFMQLTVDLMQIEARLQAVGGDTSWSLNKLEYAEKPNAVPQMPDISVNNMYLINLLL